MVSVQRNIFYCLCMLLLLQATCLKAQSFKWLQTKNDTSYISDHSNDLTVRLYGSRKYTNYKLHDREDNTTVSYKPNDNFNVGFGFNYKFLGINFGFNMPFINNDNDIYGKTKYLDLQSHLYLRKLTVDFIGQYYKGYYLANPTDVISGFNPAGNYPQRQDMHSLNLGLDVQYIFNDEKFSFRAAFLQNEYQKKSAGSVMLGASVYSFFFRADSSIVPSNSINPEIYNRYNFTRTNIYSIAAGGGYAYTYVYREHFFITASLMAEAGINYTILDNTITDDRKDHAGFQLNYTIRCAAGYNSERYFAGIHFVDITTQSDSPIRAIHQQLGAGNFRVSFVKRFKIKRRVQREIDKTLNEVLPVPVPTQETKPANNKK